jgi:uncharacterized cupredoxin-like copper-binding protein
MLRRYLFCAACAIAVSVPVLVAGAPAVSQAATARAASTTVTVIAVEFKFRLSTSTVRKGTVVFKVENKGKLKHDFKINGVKTPLISPGHTATLKVKFKKRGRYFYECTVPGHAAAGMKGYLKVT